MISMRFSALLLLVGTAAFGADPSIGKKLVFSDDFNGDNLDETKWTVFGSRAVFTFVKFGKGSALRIGLKTDVNMIQNNTITTRGKFSQQFGTPLPRLDQLDAQGKAQFPNLAMPQQAPEVGQETLFEDPLAVVARAAWAALPVLR